MVFLFCTRSLSWILIGENETLHDILPWAKTLLNIWWVEEVDMAGHLRFGILFLKPIRDPSLTHLQPNITQLDCLDSLPFSSPLPSSRLFLSLSSVLWFHFISLKSPPGLCSQDQPKQGQQRRLLHDFGTWVPLGEVKVSLSNSKLFKETQGPHSDTSHNNSYRSLSTDRVWDTEPGTVFLRAVTLVYNII